MILAFLFLLYLLIFVVTVYLAIMVYTRKSIPGSKWLAITMLDVAAWTIAALFVAFVPTIPLKEFFVAINCLFIWSSPLFFYLFIFEYIDKKKYINYFSVGFLLLMPISVQVVLSIPSLKPLFYVVEGINPNNGFPIVKFGWLFWVYCGFVYFTLTFSLLTLFFNRIFLQKIFKTHYRLIILATVVVFVTNVLYVSQITPLKGLDLTPLGVSFCCIILFYGMYAKGLFFITPINNTVLLNKVEDLFIVVNNKNQILYINKQVELLYDIDIINLHQLTAENLLFCCFETHKETPESSTAIDIRLKLNPTDKQGVNVAKQKLISLSTENYMSPFILEYFDDNNQQVFIEWSAHIDGTIKYIQGNNITEKIFAEKLNKQNYERLMQTTKHSGIIVWEVDKIGVYTYISPNVSDILGYSPDELVGKRFFYDISHEEDKEDNTKFGLTIIKTQQKLSNFENRIKTKSGSFIWVLSNGVPLLNSRGECVGFRGTDYDITERKKQQEENEILQQRILQQEKMYIDLVAEKNHADLHDLLLDLKRLKLVIKSKTVEQEFSKIIKNYENKTAYNSIDKFNENFNKLHPEFYKNLLAINKSLSSRELQICAMLKLNMSTKEISSIFNIQSTSIDIYRHRIRKKLLIQDQEMPLTAFIMSV